ncbi:hypothetical protein [Streptomyces sp. SID12488]|uniref:hypothetical protein n=1 Tax=Streptomyces sp. SID12488 TaxID=2706040 RepID=UPI0013DB3981|nr:hypothetical protein [Streptomyces sp. SID12488]NEA63417.1 hypothetical protein [Streptomyces sp. SID12488]
MLDSAVGLPAVEALALPAPEPGHWVGMFMGGVDGDDRFRQRAYGLGQAGQLVEGEAGRQHPAGGGDELGAVVDHRCREAERLGEAEIAAALASDEGSTRRRGPGPGPRLAVHTQGMRAQQEVLGRQRVMAAHRFGQAGGSLTAAQVERPVLALTALDRRAAHMPDVRESAGPLAEHRAQPVPVQVGAAQRLRGGGDGRHDGARVEAPLHEGQQLRVRSGRSQDGAERRVGPETGDPGIERVPAPATRYC